MKKMNIAIVAAECTGFAKVGGLGDVIHDLSRELNRESQETSASVFLPNYGAMRLKAPTIYCCDVKFGSRSYRVELKSLIREGVSYYFVSCYKFFGGKYGSVYVESSSIRKGPFEDDAKRFAFYSKAVLTIIKESGLFDTLNILHCHDWHMGALFLLLAYDPDFLSIRKAVKTLFTIHNLHYQGVRPFMMKFDRFFLSSFRGWFPELFERIKEDPITTKICYPANPELLSAWEFHRMLHFLKDEEEERESIQQLYQWDPKGKKYRITTHLTPEMRTNLLKNMMHSTILCFNPLRAAIQLADQISTVSRTYANEITFPDDEAAHLIRGCGLEGDLKELYVNNKLSGIVNGIDYDEYDPMRLKYPFMVENKRWRLIKEQNKKIFLSHLEEQLLEIRSKGWKKIRNFSRVMPHMDDIDFDSFLSKPLVVSIGRVTRQKVGALFEMSDGSSMVIEKLLEKDALFLFIGTGDYEKSLEIVNCYPNGIYIAAFDSHLGVDAYSSGDLFLMPSYYEPCGISQLIAMRYGTLPVVNDVGGLRDTVVDMESGFKFQMFDLDDHHTGLLKVMDRAIDCYENRKEYFVKMQETAMKVKFEWKKSVLQYIRIYKSLI